MNKTNLFLGGWANALVTGMAMLLVAKYLIPNRVVIGAVAVLLFVVSVYVCIANANKDHEPTNWLDVISFTIGAVISSVVLVGSYYLGGLSL